MTSSCFHMKDTNALVYILICLFAISSWIDINGVWVELPILVPNLPEYWKLPSYMSVIIQLANIGPLLYVLSDICYPSKVKERLVIYTIIAVGVAACLLLIFFWQSTTYIFGEVHSTGLLSLVFFLSLVDCTSSVTFLPFMAGFKSQYITALFIGEGLSGLLPSVVSLIQGAGTINCILKTNETLINGSWTNTSSYTPVYEEPLFSVGDFFTFITCMVVISGLSFCALNNLKICKSAMQDSEILKVDILAAEKSADDVSQDTDVDTIQPVFDNPSSPPYHSGSLLIEECKSRTYSATGNVEGDTSVVKTTYMSKLQYANLMIQVLWVNAMTNSVLASIQSYSSLPYGTEAYHWVVTLAAMTNPLSCFVSFFLPITSKGFISLLTFVGTCLAAFIMTLAVLSPDPPLKEETIGIIFVVVVWALVAFVFTYVKVSIAGLLRIEGRKALLWCGAVTQIGSAIGSIIMFLLVNVFELFVSAPACP